jgi:hypothetical protein
MSKMGLLDPFRYLKHKLWPKEGLGVRLPIWLSTIQSWESPGFICVKVACHILLENSWQRLQLCFRIIPIKGLQKKLWASKVMGVPISGISKLQLGSPWTKWHLGVGPMAKHREYYKREGGDFPQVWAVLNLVSLCLPVARLRTKKFQLCINQLVVWFMCE